MLLFDFKSNGLIDLYTQKYKTGTGAVTRKMWPTRPIETEIFLTDIELGFKFYVFLKQIA